MWLIASIIFCLFGLTVLYFGDYFISILFLIISMFLMKNYIMRRKQANNQDNDENDIQAENYGDIQKEYGYLQINAICPNCHINIPEDKTTEEDKCPACNEIYLIRSRPLDGKTVLVNEKQALELEKAWSEHERQLKVTKTEMDLHNLPLNSPPYKREYLTAKLYLAREDNNKAWEHLAKANLEAKNSDVYKAYRDITLFIAKVLINEEKYKDALENLCLVSYFDMCGIDNTPQIWNPENKMLDQEVIEETRNLINNMCIKENEFAFLANRVCEKMISEMNVPLEPKKALPVLTEIAFSKKNKASINIPL